MKGIANELALAQTPATEEDLVITILNDLSDDFKSISTVINARETLITIEELYEKLTNFESNLKHHEIATIPAMTANYVRRGRESDPSQRSGP